MRAVTVVAFCVLTAGCASTRLTESRPFEGRLSGYRSLVLETTSAAGPRGRFLSQLEQAVASRLQKANLFPVVALAQEGKAAELKLHLTLTGADIDSSEGTARLTAEGALVDQFRGTALASFEVKGSSERKAGLTNRPWRDSPPEQAVAALADEVVSYLEAHR